jgi:hypothetical protein
MTLKKLLKNIIFENVRALKSKDNSVSIKFSMKSKIIDLLDACTALRSFLVDIGYLEKLWEIDNITARTEKLKSEIEDYIETKHI